MSNDNTPRPDTSAQWLARVFHWVDSTEKNVVWTVEKAKAWRRMADDQWHPNVKGRCRVLYLFKKE